LQSFAIDKQKFFNDNMDAIRKLYLDNSIQRIRYEEEDIKRRILQKIIDYATGKSDELNLTDLVKEAYTSTDHLSRLFARDQMQRFNKACTLSTFRSAGVTKVKWVTVGDVRVRKSHKALNGQVFDINNLPREVDDYNCRCGLVPVEWSE
jgi:SPP1 gp7 family putative phage head morphogenesis protein